ncbi:MAG: RNA polymerase sigma factor [Clostridiales bacterium]|nr:RNA polymerase sigma factor [Clostridiales bacterium]
MERMQAVYRAYFADVYRYALSLCRDRVLAEDICSAAFLKAMESIHTYRGDNDIRFWLCRIARNHYISVLRKQKREVVMADLPEYTDQVDVSDLLADKDEGEQAMRLLDALGEPARQIVRLRALEGLSFRQIASLYQKSENWACVTYHRARKALRQQMEDENEA